MQEPNEPITKLSLQSNSTTEKSDEPSDVFEINEDFSKNIYKNDIHYSTHLKFIIFSSLMFVGFIFTVYSGIFLYTLFPGITSKQINQSVMIVQLFFYQIIPVILYFVIFHQELKPLKVLKIRKISFVNIFYILGMQFALFFPVTLLNAISLLFTENQIVESIELLDYSYLELFLFIGIIIPIVEEVIFRGVLFDIFKKFKLVYICLITGLLFGAYHMNLNQFIYATVLGYVFSLYVAYTGSLFSSIISHIVVNSTSVFFMYIASFFSYANEYTESTTLTRTEFITLFVLSFIGLIVFMVLSFFFKKYNIANNPQCLNYKNKY